MQNNVLEKLLAERNLRRDREREDEIARFQENYQYESSQINEKLAQIGIDEVAPAMKMSDNGRAFVPLELGWQIRWSSQMNDLELYNEWLNVTAKWSRAKLDEILADISSHRDGTAESDGDPTRPLDPRDLPLWKSMGIGPHRSILFTRIPGGWILRVNKRISFVPWTESDRDDIV